jgi:hypothetical protein
MAFKPYCPECKSWHWPNAEHVNRKEYSMFLPAPTGSDFETAPAGTHLAVCFRVIDLGTQKSTYSGKEKEAHKILVSWELPQERQDNGELFIIGQRYTWSMSEKATLRKHLQSWRGAAFTEKDFAGPPNGFNIKNIIGKPCLLTISHEEKDGSTYANITSVAKLMKGMTAPQPENAQIFLWLEQSSWDPNVFNVLSDGLKSIIMKSPEYTALTTPPGPPTHDIAGRPIQRTGNGGAAVSPPIQPDRENPAPPLQHPKQQPGARRQMAELAADMNDEVPF